LRHTSRNLQILALTVKNMCWSDHNGAFLLGISDSGHQCYGQFSIYTCTSILTVVVSDSQLTPGQQTAKMNPCQDSHHSNIGYQPPLPANAPYPPDAGVSALSSYTQPVTPPMLATHRLRLTENLRTMTSRTVYSFNAADIPPFSMARSKTGGGGMST
jgi:hypothetical protein